MIATEEAIRTARALIGTPYGELDCINLVKRVIRTAPGGVPKYTTAGTNSLWKSYAMSAKYKDLTWRQEGITGARAGMLAFKNSGGDVHHVGIVAERPQSGMKRGEDRESQGAAGDYASSPDNVAERPQSGMKRGEDRESQGATGDYASSQDNRTLTVIHSSSTKGCVVETELDGSWNLLAIHRYIAPKEETAGGQTEEPRAHAPESSVPRLVIEDGEGNLFFPEGGFAVRAYAAGESID